MSSRMSRYDLTRWSGLAGLASGLLIMVGAISIPVGEALISGTLFVTGHILLFFLLTGVYSTTYARTGILGFLGYVLSTIGNAMFVATQTVSSFVLTRVDVSGDFYPAAAPVMGILFSIGLLLFAAANSRVRALSAWAGWLMFVGMSSNVVLRQIPAELPELAFVIPPMLTGIGVLGLGWGLRRN